MPDWVNSPAKVYPTQSYLTNVGDAADRDSAQIKALQGLASIFGQSIKSDSTASQRMAQAKSNGTVATVSTSSFSQDILRQVDVDNLIGVEVAESWFDGKSTWYAIAVLDKSKAVDIYSDMIKKNASTISHIAKNAPVDKASFENYAAYDFAEDIAKENENHLKKLSVINPDCVANLKSFCPSSKDYNLKKIEVAKAIPIFIDVDYDYDDRLKSSYAESLSKMGFRSTDDENSRYCLKVQVGLERSDATDGKTTRCRYNVSSSIFDSFENQSFCAFTISGREGHVNYSEAENRAIKSIETKIGKNFTKTFSDFLKNLSIN